MLNPHPRPLPPPPPPLRPTKARKRRPLRRPAPASPPSTAKPGRRSHAIRREVSAGGVVVRPEGDNWYVALLKTEHKRGQVWVLPKGHVELHAGERVSDAARREVQEEAGLTDLSVQNQLGVTRFKFQAENALVYKTVHYFLMFTQQKKLTPQAEEGLIDAAWFPIDDAIKMLEYDTDQDIVSRARERILGKESTPRPSSATPRRRNLRIHT